MSAFRKRPPSLHPSETEQDAVLCKDDVGRFHWVRIFTSSIVRRTFCGRLHGSSGCRLESANGSPVHVVDVGLYLMFCEKTLQWIEIEAVAPAWSSCSSCGRSNRRSSGGRPCGRTRQSSSLTSPSPGARERRFRVGSAKST